MPVEQCPHCKSSALLEIIRSENGETERLKRCFSCNREFLIEKGVNVNKEFWANKTDEEKEKYREKMRGYQKARNERLRAAKKESVDGPSQQAKPIIPKRIPKIKPAAVHEPSTKDETDTQIDIFCPGCGANIHVDRRGDSDFVIIRRR